MKKALLIKLKNIKHERIIETIFIFTLSIILFYSLLLNPIIGKCDNGDFSRMYVWGGLNNIGSTFDGSVHRYWDISPLTLYLPWGQNWVFGVLITKISVVLTLPFTADINRPFNLSYQTVVYIILFLIAMVYIIKYDKFSKITKVILSFYIILFFTDINYISYFNSFFGEAAVIVFMFLLIGTLLNLITREKPKKWHLIIFFVSSAGFLTSKTQELPLLVFMLVIYIGIYYYYKEFRKITIIASTIIILLCTAVYFSIDSYTNMNNKYQAIFRGILMDSKTPERDLQELGIDKKYVNLKDFGFFSKNMPINPVGETINKEVYSKVSSVKVLSFYLKHPNRMWDKIKHSADYAYDFYDISSSNFEKGENWSGKFVNNFRVNLAKQTPQIHKNVYVFLGFSVIYFLISLWYLIKDRKRESKLLSLLCIFILAAGSSQAILPIIGSGEADLGKHIFLMNFSYDIMVGIALVWILENVRKLVFTKLIVRSYQYYLR